jgi:hypothetical protein
MKACGYCGRENEDRATNCRECGTEFPIQTPPPVRQEALPSLAFINLDKIEDAFDFNEGFSRPVWKMIRQAVESTIDIEDRRDALDDVVVQWLAKLKGELGGDYHLVKSRHFALLAAVETEVAQRLLNFAEGAMSSIRDSLKGIAWGNFDGLQVLLMFAEDDDYYQYISFFYPNGTHPKSVGIHIKTGYPHVAVLFETELRAGETIIHELTHHALNHLSIPLWLNEGVAVVLQKAIGGYSPPAYQGTASAYWGMVSGWTPPVIWPELAERHHKFWDEEQIQHFWAGTSFREPGDAVELSYSLAEILVHLLAKNRDGFLAFIGSARYEDAGQTAALDCLDTCLGNAAGTFLGEGNWRPQRKAIKACWEAKRAARKNSDEVGND